MGLKVKGFLREYIDIFFLFVSITLSEMMMRHFTRLPIFYLQGFLFNVFNFMIFGSLLFLIKRKARLIIETLVSCIVAFYCFTQSVHYAFFSSFYSFRKLTVINELFDVKDEIIAKLEFRHLIFLIPVILMVVIFLVKKQRTYSKKKLIIITILLISLSLGLKSICVELIRKDYKIDKDWSKDYYLYRVMQNRYKYMNRFGVVEYNMKDIELTLKPAKSKLSEEKKEEIETFINKNQTKVNQKLTNIFKNKNLILILCESFDENSIKEDLTPTLYKVKNEGLYFNNHYAPIFQVATGDSEFISQTGMLPSIDYGTTSYKFNLNNYPYALANLFKEKGYDVNSYHSYISNFYNRESIHESFGFSTFYDMDKLKIERWEGYKDTYNWAKDEDLFEEVLKNTDTNNKFFDFVITVSGHMPYTPNRIELKEAYDYINNLEKYCNLDEETKSYLAAQMLLDKGIEVLLNGLSEKGILEDTIIMMFGDHYPYGIKGEVATEYILENYTDYRKYKVPMMMYGGGIEKNEINHLTSTFDIYPTITNLFGLNDDKAYKVGKDVFVEDGRMIIFENRSILTKDFYYDSDNNIIINLDGSDVDDEDFDVYINCSGITNDIFYYGQEILLTDYYSNKE